MKNWFQESSTLFPEWYSNFLDVVGTIGLVLSVMKWIRKNRKRLRKPGPLLTYGTLIASITGLVQFAAGSRASPYIDGRTTLAWGPSGPPPPVALNTAFPVLPFVVAVVVGGLAILAFDVWVRIK